MGRVIETIDLHGGYGKHEILHGINMHVDQNEIVCIIGPNGSGKSTLVKTIYGLANHFAGKINFYEEPGKVVDISKMKANALVPLGIAYVPQRENIFPNLSIEENLRMGGYTLTDEKLEQKVADVFEAYPILEERKDLLGKTLSGGQRQLLALGRALMIDPNLIILDEPSAALQPSLVLEIMKTIKELKDVHKKTVLLVEQNTKSALNISDRGYIIAAGVNVYENTGYELLNNTDLGYYYMGGKEVKSNK